MESFQELGMASFPSQNFHQFYVLKSCHQTLNARELGSLADKKAMEFVFPNCRKKPFQFRSFKNIVAFLKRPSSDEFCSPTGPQAWSDLGGEVKANIEARVHSVLARFPDLVISIHDLKCKGDVVANPPLEVPSLRDYFESVDDTEGKEAVEACQAFLEANLGNSAGGSGASYIDDT